ncbi:hypothetical protein [Gelidibacter sp.]|uniref:hypothetical protein n=1 Tax=Gelidibacter sp. TaxID=2018083 RepID=UPI002CD1BD5B|nr:hypothetical protein [Gelidibacter sp.]HUH28143.1 hypothetical protein [Gelidibacter sp.]
MNINSTKTPPAYFWIVGIIALLWNIFGVYNYIMQTFMTAGKLSSGSHTQQNLYEDLPIWFISIFSIAVFAGLLGAISWLLRKKVAYILFIISFLAVGIQQFYVLTEINPRDIFIPLTSIVIVVFLIWFSKRAIAKEWLK